MQQRKEKIIQFGEGAFLRGFVDWMVQILNERADFNASVVVVQPIAKGMCEALEAQDCIYTHVMRGLKEGKPTVEKKRIDVISRTVRPYEDYDAYVKLAENPDFRFVVSNTTEAGIVYEKGDALCDAPQKTFPAKVCALLYKRFTLSLPGFIFLPCELIDKNGETLKNCVLQYAKDWALGDAFEKWVKEQNVFCNTLVDRIVTGYPREEKIDVGFDDKMLNTSELFHLWVIQGGEAVAKEIPFDKVDLNVIFTDDLEKYRTRKVRVLNGAHTSMIPYALLSGLETVGDCMKDKKMRAFLEKCVFEEILPTLEMPEAEKQSYAADVLERFENPFIRHLCAAISLNSVSKFKVRVLPSLLAYYEKFGKLPQNLVFSLAKLIEFYKEGTPSDDKQIIEYFKTHTLAEILANTAFWDTDLSFLEIEVTRAYAGH